jgi:hypothetical protein
MTTTFQPSPVTTVKAASGAQAHFILTLQGMPKDDDNRSESALAICETMTMKEASALITTLKASPLTVTSTPVAPKFSLESGQWHFLAGVFLRVAKSQSTGKLYAKARVPGEGFVFAQGIIYKLGESTLVNASHTEEISAYGHTHHRCVFCNLPLDQPESITAGYGQVCGTNRGLPWN